mmetsp:Transcript_27229/g.58272  ORF Transcript_27229/g.58272 Transcript_27229/m.58272 type:complete len:421 (+) Transcript_27229:159-1421(+)
MFRRGVQRSSEVYYLIFFVVVRQFLVIIVLLLRLVVVSIVSVIAFVTAFVLLVGIVACVVSSVVSSIVTVLVVIVVVVPLIVLVLVHLVVGVVVLCVLLSVVVVTTVSVVVARLEEIGSVFIDLETSQTLWLVSLDRNPLGDLVQDSSLVLGRETGLGARCLEASCVSKQDRVFHVINNNTAVLGHVSGHGGVNNASIKECSVSGRMDAIIQEELGVDVIGAFLVDCQEGVSNRGDVSLGPHSGAFVDVFAIDLCTFHDKRGEGGQIRKTGRRGSRRCESMRLHNDGRNAFLLQERTICVVEGSKSIMTGLVKGHSFGLISENDKIPRLLEISGLFVFTVGVLLKARVVSVVDEGSQSVSDGNHLIVSGQKLGNRAGTHIVQVLCSVSVSLEPYTTLHSVRRSPLGPHTVSGHEDLQDAC